MFERFTEAARRALFFARYEASQWGSAVIGTEHVLLGLLRQPHPIVASLLALSGQPLEALRDEVRAEIESKSKISTSVEIPFTEDTKKALTFTAEEAGRLGHTYIGPEHMLLGLLRVEGCVPEKILTLRHAMRLYAVREELVRLMTGPMAGHMPRNELLDHVARIRSLVDKLFDVVSDPRAATEVAHAIEMELGSLIINLEPGESE
jgi:ATP-dependent Clp protease ATP-binding subunit ClpC